MFGYVTKYLIYKPSVKFYDAVVFEKMSIEERHRGFLHSVLGLGTATVLTGLYLIPILYALDLFSAVFVRVFLLAYLVGSLLHLVEDSCTRSRIQWTYPFCRFKILGNLKTTPKLRDTIYQRIFLMVLGVGAGLLFFLPSVHPRISVTLFALVGLGSGILLWLGFAIIGANCEVY